MNQEREKLLKWLRMQEIPETIEWKSYAKESSLQFLQSAVTCWPCNWHTAEMFRLVLLLLFIYWRLNFCSGLLLRNDLLLHGISANIHCRCDFWMSKNHCTNIVYISDIIFVCVCVMIYLGFVWLKINIDNDHPPFHPKVY